MSLLAPALLFTAIFMAYIATLNQRLGGPSEPPGWTTAAAVGLAAYSLLIPPYLMLSRRHIFGKGREQLVANNIDPVRLHGLLGLTMFLSPTILAMFLTFAGFPLLIMYITTAYSLVGMAAWMLLYRR